MSWTKVSVIKVVTKVYHLTLQRVTYTIIFASTTASIITFTTITTFYLTHTKEFN